MCNMRNKNVQALDSAGFFLNPECVTLALPSRNSLRKLLVFLLLLLENTAELLIPKSCKALVQLEFPFSVTDVTRNTPLPLILRTAICGGCTKVQSSQSLVRHPWCRLCEFRFCITASRTKAIGLGPYPYTGASISFTAAGSSCHCGRTKKPNSRTIQQKETRKYRRTR